jgi:hypothetical protein
VREIESKPTFYPHARFHDSRRFFASMSSSAREAAENCTSEVRVVPGTLPHERNWMALRAGCEPACIIAKELDMRNKILAIAAIAGAMSVPVAAQAQGVVTTGVAPGGAVVVEDVDGIAVDQRPAFREYIIREHVPSYTIPDRVIVGGMLPEIGVIYYDVPQTYGVTPYRYTVVNGQTVLVEPRTRRIVQVVE